MKSSTTLLQTQIRVNLKGTWAVVKQKMRASMKRREERMSNIGLYSSQEVTTDWILTTGQLLTFMENLSGQGLLKRKRKSRLQETRIREVAKQIRLLTDQGSFSRIIQEDKNLGIHLEGWPVKTSSGVSLRVLLFKLVLSLAFHLK